MNLLSLLQLSDPALPIGGYAHSAGLETYVQAGIVCDPASAEKFVRGILQTSVRYTDAALMVLAYRATNAGDHEELLRLDGVCEAVKLPREIREAGRKLGGRLLKIFEEQLRAMSRELRATSCKLQAGEKNGLRHYCVVFGYCAASLGIGLQEALTGFYYNTAAGMVTNCVKLIPMGQQDGQALLFSLQPLIIGLVSAGLEPDEGMIGMSCIGLDIRCMQHEQLYSRLYMS